MRCPSHPLPDIVMLSERKYQTTRQQLPCDDISWSVRVDARSTIEEIGGGFVRAKDDCALAGDI